MANWCENRIAIYAKTKEGIQELKNLYMRIRGLGTDYHGIPEKDMGYTTEKSVRDEKTSEIITKKETEKAVNNWYGLLLVAHGVKIADINDCRGFIEDEIEWCDSPEPHIYLRTETAWDPKEHILDTLVSDFYKNLDYVMTAEECGMGIYINTDVDAIFFPERYYLEWDMCGWGGDSDYLESDEELSRTMRRIIKEVQEKFPEYKSKFMDKIEKEGVLAMTEDDAYEERDAIEKYLSSKENGDYEYFSIHKFESC